MGTKRTSSSLRFDRRRLLLLLIPAAAAFIPGLILMGSEDTVSVVRFMLTLLLFAAASYPLSVMLFPLSRSGGITLAKPLGLLITGLFIWTLTYLKIGRFNTVFIFITIGALAFACWYPRTLREKALTKLKAGSTIENIVIEETVFALALTVFCFFKGFLPNINGQEKFMDYGFMMSMIRNPKLPANDMWLSGYSINYYYFGQYLYALLTKISFIYTGTAYNICMCCSIALPFAMCFSIGQMLIDGAREHGMKCGGKAALITGLLAAFAVMVFGNSHSFYYDENSVGNGLLHLFSGLGINVGRTDSFFYPDSTRFIGHNPDSALIEGIRNGGDYTIEEFPFYSYLIGDLHAHVCSTAVVLLIIALAVSLTSRILTLDFTDTAEKFSGTDTPFSKRLITEIRNVLSPEIVSVSILLGICQMTNYWDFLIYFIFGSMLLLLVGTYKSKDFSTVFGALIFTVTVGGILGIYLAAAYIPLLHAFLQAVLFAAAIAGCAAVPCALTRTSAGMSFLFAVSSVVCLPFNMNFEMISNKIAPCVNRSSLFQLFILWGTHVIICVTFIIFVVITKKPDPSDKKRKAAIDAGFSNPVQRFFKQRNPVDVLVSGSIIVGLLLLAAPEIFYVRDIYTGGYLRSNTMFKFTYAGFILLSLCMAYAVIRMFYMDNRNGGYNTAAFAVAVIFCLLLFVPAHYPFVSLKQRCGDISKENYKTLNGTAYIDTYTSSDVSNVTPGNLKDYMECVNWFMSEVKGDPVILEAYGLSYTDYNIVSAYTGLPTVCGWQTHEWLWRFHGIVDKETDLLVSDPERDVWARFLTPRHTDIDTIYTSQDIGTIKNLIDSYDISYVVLGDLERSKYNGYDNTSNIASLGRIVFVSGSLVVIQIF
ncbi:MAG: hypothetical protein IKN80_07355 [Clostridiales bacterium]|nr:hypothetical protein [Clostridiales bacterium]